jgi:nucleoside recognition membrane protein YjiH
MDVSQLLKNIVPSLASALGGPLAGAAAAFIADKLGFEDKTVQAVTDALSNGKLSPDQIVLIKQSEAEFNMFLERNKIDLAKISADDTKDARAMQVATRSLMPAVLTLLITIGFFGVLGWMLYDEAVVDSPPLLIMLGSLGTAWTGCCAFWFGTTHGSMQKNQLLADAAPRA